MPESPRVTPERVLDLLHAFERTDALVAALELDLFTAIGARELDLHGLVARTGGSPRGVRALVNYLVTIGLLAVTPAGYSLTPESRRYLDRGSPEYLGGMAQFLSSPPVREGYARLGETIQGRRTATPGPDTTRVDHPVWVAYARGMASVFRGPSEAVAQLVQERAPQLRRILDVAAGHGLFGIALARRFPAATVTSLDAPDVLSVAREQATAAKVEDRFRWLPGDAFATPLGEGYDVAVLANFVHHFDPGQVTALLRRVRAALVPEGLVALVEFVPDEDHLTPPAAAQFGLTMVATTPGGDVYTFRELVEILEHAGLGAAELLPLPHTPQRAVVARRIERGAAGPPL